MVWFGLILFVAIVVALMRGGRLSNLADIELRLWWLLPLGFLMQAGTELVPESEDSLTIATWLILASFIPLSVVVIANRSRAGLWLSGLGIAMNATVIALNFGMPVMSEAAQIAGGSEGTVLINDLKYVLLDGSTRLAFLADVIPVRLFGLGQVVSIGDVLLAVGLGRFVESELRRPIRWFKHAASSRSGSAAEH